MAKRKLSPTPVRRQPRRAAKKSHPSPSPPPPPVQASKRFYIPVNAAQIPMASSDYEAEPESDFFFTEDEATDLPALSCPPFASPTEQTKKPILPPLKEKLVSTTTVEVNETINIISHQIEEKLVASGGDTPGSSKKGEDLGERPAIQEEPVVRDDDDVEISSIDVEVGSTEIDAISDSDEESQSSPTDTHSRVFDTNGILVHESHSKPGPELYMDTSARRAGNTSLVRNITYPKGGRLHYYHSEDGTLFPSVKQTKRNPHVTDQEFQIATTLKLQNEEARIIPYDFDVPYGYDGFVKISGRPQDETEVVETVNWIPAMRSQDIRDSLRKQHERITGTSTSVTTTIITETRSSKEANMSVDVPTVKRQENYVRRCGPGQDALFDQKLAEHRGERPLTFTSVGDFPGLTVEQVDAVNEEYVDNQAHDYVLNTETAPYGYPGLTQWNWTGSRVYELIDWTKPRRSKLSRRASLVLMLKECGKLFMTAKGTKGISDEQGEIADQVLRCYEMYGDMPNPEMVPYGYGGYVNTDETEEPFLIDWDPVTFNWEYETDETEFWEAKMDLIIEGKEEDLEFFRGFGDSWWRGGLRAKKLMKAKRKGYVPWSIQIWADEWDGDVRELDFGHVRGNRVRTKLVRYEDPALAGDCEGNVGEGVQSEKFGVGDQVEKKEDVEGKKNDKKGDAGGEKEKEKKDKHRKKNGKGESFGKYGRKSK